MQSIATPILKRDFIGVYGLVGELVYLNQNDKPVEIPVVEYRIEVPNSTTDLLVRMNNWWVLVHKLREPAISGGREPKPL
jgi:hypothetical protein